MNTRVIVRPPLRFPDWESAPPAFKRMVARVEVQAEEARASAAANQLAASKLWFSDIPWHSARHELTHPLSASWLGNHVGVRSEEFRGVVAELDAYLSVRARLVDGMAADDPGGFVDSLIQAWAHICPAAGVELRTTSIGLERGLDTAYVKFGEASQLRFRLESLFFEYRRSELPKAMRAIAAMAVLLNIHPFPDGNGRCARALFNAALIGCMGDDFSAYVPLKAVLQASDAGFEIRLREAETNGNWAPLAAYFTSVFATLAKAHYKAEANA